MLFKTIEEINAWQESIQIVKFVYKIINKNIKLSKDYGLKDQIQRSSISIPSNIAEGFERDTKAEFIRFLFIAKGSCGELRTQVYLASELNYISIEDYQLIDDKCRKVSSMIMNLIKSLRR